MSDELYFSVETYVQFLDGVVAECGSVPALTPASNAVTRRAKASYAEERSALLRIVARDGVTGFAYAVYDETWPKLCKNKKHGVLRHDYADARKGAHDMRYPQDGRVVPGYAKDALAQLRTLTKCVIAARDQLLNTLPGNRLEERK